MTFSGLLELALCDQLDELVVNPAFRRTIGGETGAIAYVVASSAALPTMTGYYLLQTFDSSPDGINPDWPFAHFTLAGVFVGALS